VKWHFGGQKAASSLPAIGYYWRRQESVRAAFAPTRLITSTLFSATAGGGIEAEDTLDIYISYPPRRSAPAFFKGGLHLGKEKLPPRKKEPCFSHRNSEKPQGKKREGPSGKGSSPLQWGGGGGGGATTTPIGMVKALKRHVFPPKEIFFFPSRQLCLEGKRENRSAPSPGLLLI